MLKEYCLGLVPSELRGQAWALLEAGYNPDFVYMFLKSKVVKTISGTPPLTFKSSGKPLKNYRIYGNTVNGASVGDLITNYFDYNSWKDSVTGVSAQGSITFNNDGTFTLTANENGDVYTLPYEGSAAFRIDVEANTEYTFGFSSDSSIAGYVYAFENGQSDSAHRHIAHNARDKKITFTTNSDTTYLTIRFGVANPNTSITYGDIMIIEGDTVPEAFLPYGNNYVIPVICGTKNIFDIEQYNPDNVTVQEDGSYRIHSASEYCWCIPVEIGKKYTVSISVMSEVEISSNLEIYLAYGDKVGYPGAGESLVFLTVKNKPAYQRHIITRTFTASESLISIGGLSTNIYYIMINEGEQSLPYEPYGTKTTDIYLDEPLRKIGTYTDRVDFANQKVIRQVVRQVFDGTEDFAIYSNQIRYPFDTVATTSNNVINCSSNHLTATTADDAWLRRTEPNLKCVASDMRAIRFVWNNSNGESELEAFKAQLAEWHANGNPLIVDYTIETPVEEQVTLPTISTLAGTNTLTFGTTVQPSKVEITYKR